MTEFQFREEKMNPNKLFVIITELDQIEICKKARVTNFLFPLSHFSVGYPNTFSLKDIKEEGYLFINRILDTQSYQELKKLLLNIPKNIKGIVFEDMGIITLAQELNLKLELILYQSHFATNPKSINENLNFVDSIVISTDITKEEINEILIKSHKPLVYFLYGLVPVMYSRRTLLTNFETEFMTKKENIVTLEEHVGKKKFIAVENEYGTVLYHEKYVHGLYEINDDKIKYYLINPLFLSKEKLEKILNDFKNKIKEMDDTEEEGFLNTKTIYKIKEDV